MFPFKCDHTGEDQQPAADTHSAQKNGDQLPIKHAASFTLLTSQRPLLPPWICLNWSYLALPDRLEPLRNR